MRFFAVLLVFVMGCAGTQAMDTAIRATNVLGVTLEHADQQLAPELANELREASEAHPTDDVAYRKAIAAPLELYRAFEDARDAQRWLHLGVEQWQDGDDGAMWHEVLPCAVEAFDQVVTLLHAHDTELQLVLDTLKQLAGGTACRRKP